MEFSIEEVNKINNRLAIGESIRTISTDLKLNKSTISDLFKKNGYNYNIATRQYVSNVVGDKLDDKPTIKPKIANKLVFSIPTKIKKKADTKAFNIVVKINLADRLDLICKEKGDWSRNELINYILEFFVDNMDK